MIDTRFTSLEVSACSWGRPDWVAGFYPGDLPADWRLSYYSNEFNSVLVPADILKSTKIQDYSAWRQDVSARFGFYVELAATTLEGVGERTLAGLDLLGGSLRGLVLVNENETERFSSSLSERYPGAQLLSRVPDGNPATTLLWIPGVDEGAGSVGLARFDSPPDAMALRQLIESFLYASTGPERTLFLDAPYETLETAETIARLMGY